jgi:hypothetical protein
LTEWGEGRLMETFDAGACKRALAHKSKPASTNRVSTGQIMVE